MNREAKRHLDVAAGYIEKGDKYYARAADEIIAAMQADPTLSYAAVSEQFGKAKDYARRLVLWRTSDAPERGEPVDWGRGSHGTKEEIQAGAEKLLAEAPLEIVERMVEKLPAERVARLTQAGLAKPGVVREMAKDPEAAATVIRASGEVHEERVASIKKRRKVEPTDLGVVADDLDFLANVIGTLVQARKCLRDAYRVASEHELSDDQRDVAIGRLDELASIIDWFKSYLQSGDQSFEEELGKLLQQ